MINIQFITSQGCSECERAKKILSSLGSRFPNIQIEEIDIISREGIKTVIKHQVMASPTIIINGNFFSSGFLDEKKLHKKLEEEGSYGKSE